MHRVYDALEFFAYVLCTHKRILLQLCRRYKSLSFKCDRILLHFCQRYKSLSFTCDRILLHFCQRYKSLSCTSKLSATQQVEGHDRQLYSSLLCSVCSTYLGEGCVLYRCKDLTYCPACKDSMLEKEKMLRRQRGQRRLASRSSQLFKIDIDGRYSSQ